MTGAVTARRPLLPSVDRRQVLRYAGVREGDAMTEALLDACLAELDGAISPRICFAEVPVVREGDLLDLGFARVGSAALSAHLAACDRAVVLAATVGVGIDRLIARYGALSPARALLFQAIGTERVETLCDLLCNELAAAARSEGCLLTSRFSPGYRDLPLTLQREIFTLLEPSRRIGLSLNASLLMSPSKSVTAIVGITKNDH
ncbi:MAG: Vitamin B12 dependent methionine synthase activation subunit [Ruminococcaceae bacterium]|nr:Vitamin B12 dependent methionine synthase activation subunit [Oscillospiraceae bacterium]